MYLMRTKSRGNVEYKVMEGNNKQTKKLQYSGKAFNAHKVFCCYKCLSLSNFTFIDEQN